MTDKIYLPYYLRMPSKYGEYEITYFEFCNNDSLDFFHKHQYVELCYVTKGILTIDLQNDFISIPAFHCILIEPGCIHKSVTNSELFTEYFILRFNQTLKNPLKDNYMENAFVKKINNAVTNKTTHKILYDQYNCHHIIAQIKEEIQNQEWGYKIVLGNLCSNLVFLSLRNLPTTIFKDDEKDLNPYPFRKNDLMEIVHFIRKNYNEALTAKIVADNFHISERQLNRWLKDYLGQGFSDILNFYRYESAKKLLAQDMSLEEIAYHIGFQSTRSLYNLFNKYENCSPIEHRAKLNNV